MFRTFDVSVIIPTYNRARMLAAAIKSVLGQAAGAINYELVVVDNNSDDDTRQVVEDFMARNENLRYFFEEKQGVSYARNTGIKNTSSDILAFMDDDVIAAGDWLRTIKQCFDQNPDVLFVGGKVLPRWNALPPSWLTARHWSPLALVDHGDDTFLVDWDRQICLVSANLGVRRTAFDRFGLFTTELGRCEDHEFEFRLLRGGAKGLYTPDLVMTADVQNERLEKAYHRVWWTGHGKRLAQFRAYETPHTDNEGESREAGTIRLLGTPSHLYKELFKNVFEWLTAWIRRRESEAFYFELQTRDLFNYIVETYHVSVSGGRFPILAGFAPRLVLKKIRNYLN